MSARSPDPSDLHPFACLFILIVSRIPRANCVNIESSPTRLKNVSGMRGLQEAKDKGRLTRIAFGKAAYKPIALHERREFIFNGILKVLKHNDSRDVIHLVDMIRSDALPQEIAACLSQNLHQLQDRGLISSLEVDEMDLVSLGLQGLFSHRGKRATLISKDQTNYNATTSKTYTANGRDALSDHLDSSASDNLSSVNQDFHSFIKDASLASPVTTETSGSLCSEESYATAPSGYKPPMSNGGGLNNSAASGPLSVRSKEPRGNYYNPPTLESDIGNETHRQSLERSKAQRTRSIRSSAFEGSENPQGPTYNPMSSTDRLYVTFSENSRGGLDERMTRDHLESHKPMNRMPVSAEGAPPIEWRAQRWAYEVSKIHSTTF
ncbi:hypothetical protein H2198_009513 [Neophaeococcomyces mojaviensis]|uniref:Uncharacterized protein n=1 Tax=Neophaeococcomyces mojaviensis TaxID=3383035 RepID=A0ACC2ZUB6_9EURO|nr:hypothetical protein H2198_009513 [Knufia sp. JES_112]